MNFYKLFIYFLLFFSILFSINAKYYADISIDVDKYGEVTIDGTSNYEGLINVSKSPLYTSKNKNVWIFNLTINENFDNFIYELSLPKFAQTNYIKTTPTFRIAEENNRIKLIGTGENRELMILVQYTINKRDEFISENKNLVDIVSYLLAFIVLIGVIYFYSRIKKNVKSIINFNNRNDNISKDNFDMEVKKKEFDYSILPQRQIDIVNLLKKNNKMTQKEIEDEMDIPKSSISRNVKTLVVRGIILKERIGSTNYLSLKK